MTVLSDCYQYGLIVCCCLSACKEITALFTEADSDSFTEVEKHNLPIF